jgi:hypothetical protein
MQFIALPTLSITSDMPLSGQPIGTACVVQLGCCCLALTAS